MAVKYEVFGYLKWYPNIRYLVKSIGTQIVIATQFGSGYKVIKTFGMRQEN